MINMPDGLRQWLNPACGHVCPARRVAVSPRGAWSVQKSSVCPAFFRSVQRGVWGIALDRHVEVVPSEFGTGQSHGSLGSHSSKTDSSKGGPVPAHPSLRRLPIIDYSIDDGSVLPANPRIRSRTSSPNWAFDFARAIASLSSITNVGRPRQQLHHRLPRLPQERDAVGRRWEVPRTPRGCGGRTHGGATSDGKLGGFEVRQSAVDVSRG